MPEPISTKVSRCARIVGQAERREVGGDLVVAGLDELGEAEVVAGDVVEHPPGLAHHLVGRALLLASSVPAAFHGHVTSRVRIGARLRPGIGHFRSGSGAE